MRQVSGATIARLAAAGLLLICIGVLAVLGLPLALLFAAGAFLVGVVFLFWNSVQSLTGETELTLDEAMSLGAPSQEEERKRAVLRALKDLEYERAVGKVSEEDFVELSARYRAEAKALLQALDAELAPARERAEARLARRLKASGENGAEKKRARKRKRKKVSASSASDAPSAATEAVATPPEDGADSDDVSPSQPAASGGSAPAVIGLLCESCDTRNDADARFCKGCGSALEAAG